MLLGQANFKFEPVSMVSEQNNNTIDLFSLYYTFGVKYDPVSIDKI